ncbi:sensor histidine kinase [Shinella zoogloeoides]|uniref:sensor histidine kinase n=1 Tax=Shinella zoogloeoides TaxID=352475 RepID=UPI00299CF1BC|nr:ATP-binding protein [Shinella zoogloeoides]
MVDAAATSPRFHRAHGFRSLSQPIQFALSGGLIMLAAMFLAGVVISGIVTRAAVESTAASSALFLDSLLSPLVQQLARREVLGPQAIARLDEALKEGAFADRFAHVDIWRSDGLAAYSTTSDLIGGRFPPPEGAAMAFDGEVSARYTDLAAGEHVARAWTTKYLEIYVPLREHGSGRIIAVVEIHELTQPLEAKLLKLRVQTWLVVSGAALSIALALTGVVYSNSRLIGRQQVALESRLAEIERVSHQNSELRMKVQRASGRLVEMNESYLRNVGAELHDGPVQLIGLSALKIEQVRRAADKDGRAAILTAIEGLLGDALHDMRAIARGLVLPEIQALSLREIVESVVRVHERRTGTAVSLICDGTPPSRSSQAMRLCAYRFVQEGLNNAYRHAGGHGQTVECRHEGDVFVLRVSDDGAGTAGRPETSEGSLGLFGLRERVESLGGTFSVRHGRQGTVIEMATVLNGGDEV